ncbi:MULTISPECIES: ATP-binding protein [Pseudomonas]|uniref:ATP-binding protein n=1 Tax=Pseudomonas nitroreducens TaxID=46680 RepID=UPI001E2A9E35|nr:MULTISPECIES: ATP-binding protein [Pseudomonas]MCE4073568.1 ATP-binding protein [Pseudomonas nitritireducens]MCE4082770.1 ATP-binding protein [Pseudomonas nitroreducens]
MTVQNVIIDGTPEKRLFLSIISDYNLQTGLCELIDNAIDHWMENGRSTGFRVDVQLDSDRQIIEVNDNAGGIKGSDLRLLVAPGASGNKLGQELIGIFGVGGKRAGVALGERVEIRTRYRSELSFRVEINSDWLASESWSLQATEIPSIDEGCTQVVISMLRQTFSESDVEFLRRHFSETYSWFIEQGCCLFLNDISINPATFESWSFPPEYLPRSSRISINPGERGPVEVEIVAGLISDRNPELENYGVYFYCNNRLVVKELRSRDVGYFVTSEAGVPHPDASLCRVIVKLVGAAELMPWNSSKSGINFNHPVFVAIRPALIQFVSYYSSLSRRLKADWSGSVFNYNVGQIEPVTFDPISLRRKLILPKLPRVRKLPLVDVIKDANKDIILDKPWVLGLVEALGVVDVVSKLNLETKNRSALILLDSNFEISLKEFIVSRQDLFPANIYNDTKISSIFKSRHQVIQEVAGKVEIPSQLLSKASYYYNMRNKLVHERATVNVADSQVYDYGVVVRELLEILFGLRFK